MSASFLVSVFKVYSVVGLAFAGWFVSRGAWRLDPAAGEGTLGFRVLLVPGAMALWPYLVWRLLAGGPAPREEHNAHRHAARRGPA